MRTWRSSCAASPRSCAYNLVPGWLALTLGVTFGGGLGFAGTALAGIFFPYKAKEVYAASPGAKYTVNSYLGMLLGIGGRAGLDCGRLGDGPSAFPTSMFLITLIRTACIVGVIAFLWPLRAQLPGWFRGEKMPWPTALGMLGGGLGMTMVLSFLLAPALGRAGKLGLHGIPNPSVVTDPCVGDRRVLHRLVCLDEAVTESQGHQH